jgi:hypothetical protein
VALGKREIFSGGKEGKRKKGGEEGKKEGEREGRERREESLYHIKVKYHH